MADNPTKRVSWAFTCSHSIPRNCQFQQKLYDTNFRQKFRYELDKIFFNAFYSFLAFDKKVETIIYDGWGFVTPNEKSGVYNISENHDGITFQTTVGGIFIVAQMDPDNGESINRKNWSTEEDNSPKL